MKFPFMNTPPNAAMPVSSPTSRPRPTASSPSATSVANRLALGSTTVCRNHTYQPGVPSDVPPRDHALDGRAVAEQPLAARDLAPAGGQEDVRHVQPDDEPQPRGRRGREQEARPARLLELVRGPGRMQELLDHGLPPLRPQVSIDMSIGMHGDGDAVRQGDLRRLARPEAEALVERHPGSVAIRSSSPVALGAGRVPAGVEDPRPEAAPRPVAAHEHRADVRGLRRRVEGPVRPSWDASPLNSLSRRLQPPQATTSPPASSTKYVPSSSSIGSTWPMCDNARRGLPRVVEGGEDRADRGLHERVDRARVRAGRDAQRRGGGLVRHRGWIVRPAGHTNEDPTLSSGPRWLRRRPTAGRRRMWSGRRRREHQLGNLGRLGAGGPDQAEARGEGHERRLRRTGPRGRGPSAGSRR